LVKRENTKNRQAAFNSTKKQVKTCYTLVEAVKKFLLTEYIMYEGDTNENLKSAIKIQNTARLSCKLTTMMPMVLRMADRWQYDVGMQRDGAVVV
jgi:hypothetical protein